MAVAVLLLRMIKEWRIYIMTKEEAIMIANSEWYLNCSDIEITAFQVYEEKLCMPFDIFHEAVETSLGRPVWTHEFADIYKLQKEFEVANLNASELREKMSDAIDDILKDIKGENYECKECENDIDLQY